MVIQHFSGDDPQNLRGLERTNFVFYDYDVICFEARLHNMTRTDADSDRLGFEVGLF